MTLLNKFKNEQNRQLQIQAQLAEQSYRVFNGVKQSRENERSGELRKKMNDDLPASSLTKEMIQDYQREEEEEDFFEDKGAAYKYRPLGATEDLIDLTLFGILQGNAKTNWLLIPLVGIGYFVLYYLLFRERI